MNISRFFGATNREVLRQVRLALGPDALIISNKRVNGGVEILATDQTSLPDAGPSAAPARPAAPAAPRPAAAPPSPAPHAAAGPAPGMPGADLMGAIGELKGSLETRIDELLWGSQLRRSPQAVTLFQNLLRFGFSTALLRAMLKHMPEQAGARAAFQWARNELVRHLPVLEAEDALWQPGLALALVGPTGVGKTTTVAKLAARCVRRSGPGSLVLLTTDTYRIGAHEQLKIYGQMLRVPVHVVQDIHEMRRIVQTVRPDQTLLIDNVGISQRDRYIHEQAALLAGAGRRIERLLVLNAVSHGDTLDEVARSYAGDGGTPLRGCIVSKIDEASRLGAALDTAIRYKLPIHYVSNGQKVPENLLFLPAAELVDRALAPIQANRALYAPSEADLAALLSMTQPADSPDAAAERRRQQILLPQLLTGSASGDALGMDQLRAAVTLQDEDPVLSEAYDLWRSRAAGGLPPAAEAIEHLRRVAHGGLDETQPALVVHARQSLDWQGRRGAWSGAAWFDGQGRPLAAATQQIGLADGWHTPQGAWFLPSDRLQAKGVLPGGGRPEAQRGGRIPAPSAADALLAQIETETEDAPSAVLHVFDGGSQALLRALSARERRWLAACSPRARVFLDDEPGVLSAAVQSLMYQPLDAQTFWPLLSAAGLEDARPAWWAALGEAELRVRGEPALPVRVFSLRAVDPRDGRLLKVWHAVAGMAVDPDPGRIARALILRQECQAAWRQAAPLLAEAGREPLVDRAVFVAQMGLAAWRLAQDPALAPAARVAARMLGADRLAPRHAHAGLLKLYALKELLAN
ncbi:flagellar biosynthesis protein FlhF [Castellaniella defragrans]|uniref:flagellar biosynthesis protein FlhF n=1 Tax=Castellaniella defragrans TaxID=75697 RepID=UPI0023F08DEB|nr:flagellar biosynthesis protein FlhF [Castellaniella defragrans]